MQRDPGYLLDIQGAGKKIQQFLENHDQSEFLGDALIQAAVYYQMAIIGEAVGKLSETFRSTHANIPWQRIKGLRNHLIHAYGDVDPREVWRVTREDLPNLLAYIAPLIPPDSD